MGLGDQTSATTPRVFSGGLSSTSVVVTGLFPSRKPWLRNSVVFRGDWIRLGTVGSSLLAMVSTLGGESCFHRSC